MQGTELSVPPSPASPNRKSFRTLSHVSNSHTSPANRSDEASDFYGSPLSGCLEVSLTFPGIAHEGGDGCAVDAQTTEKATLVSSSRMATNEKIVQDSKKDNSENIYVKRHALFHSIYARVSDKTIDWALEDSFAQARYSHFRAAFAQASMFMLLGVVALAINAGIFHHWERVGILLGVVMPIYLLCAYIVFRHEQHFLRLSGTSGEKLLIAALCVQTLAIVLAECVRPELDYGMLAMHIGYLNNFTPMNAFSMQMVSAVCGILPYCLAKIITFITPAWTYHDMVHLRSVADVVSLEDNNHRVADLAICTPADPNSEAQLVTSMLVPVTIFLYQVLVTFRRDVSMRWDSLFKHNLQLKKQMLDIEQQKNEDMLSSMLPKQIITALKAAQLLPNCQNIEPQHFQDVTVIFVEICDFDRLCSSVPARDVVEVLNIVYHEFDRLSDLLHVYKVETVAQVYMAVVGAPHPVSNHADVAAHFGLALMHSMELMRPRLDSIIKTSKQLRASLLTPLPPQSDPAPLPVVNEVSIPGMCNRVSDSQNLSAPAEQPRLSTGSDEDLTVLIRIGLNSGQLFAGVVGMDSPRYKLVGDTVNTASRMESTCAKGKIQVSQTTKAKLTENMFILKENGEIPVKGKGTMSTYTLTGYAGSDTYETRTIIIEKAMQIAHHTSCSSLPTTPEARPAPGPDRVDKTKQVKSNWSLWNVQASREHSVIQSKDGDAELVTDNSMCIGPRTFNVATSRKNEEEDCPEVDRPLGQVLQTIGAERWGNNPGDNVRFTCWQRLVYFFLLVPASEKKAKRVTELNADKPYYLELKLKKHLDFARNLTIIMPLVLSVLCVVDLVESGVTSGLDKKLSYRDVILVRDLGNSFVALMYVFVLSVFTLSRPMAQACTIVMLLLQFAALLTAGMFLWETERGIVAIIAMFGAYVLFYTVCTLLQRLAVCATAIMTYVVMKATLCDRSVEALQNVGFLLIFIAAMTCSVWLQEHLSHVFHFEQRVATKCLEQIKDAKSVGAQLLTDLLPSHVVDLVRAGISPIAETYDGVTILFTDIKGFTKFSTSISPQRLCHVLNSMFSNFDEIISTWDLHKVEIIGDAYWVSAGCPAKPCLQEGADDESTPSKTKTMQIERAEFAMRAVEVGLALLRALPSVCDDTSLQMRVGIHTGPVVAGVVGKNGPRYHLFGTTVGYAEKMESSGIPGRVQISDVTHTLLEAGGHAYDYEERTVEIEEEEQPVPTWLVNKSNAREAIQIQKKLMEERRRQST